MKTQFSILIKKRQWKKYLKYCIYILMEMQEKSIYTKKQQIILVFNKVTTLTVKDDTRINTVRTSLPPNFD